MSSTFVRLIKLTCAMSSTFAINYYEPAVRNFVGEECNGCLIYLYKDTTIAGKECKRCGDSKYYMGCFWIDDEVSPALPFLNCEGSACWNSDSLVVHTFRFIYTGSVEINIDLAQDLLRAADQYLLDGLKRLCECTIAQVNWYDYFNGCFE